MAGERLTLLESKRSPKGTIDPCNRCDFEPADCGNQRAVEAASGILCGLGKGFVRRIEIPVSDILITNG